MPYIYQLGTSTQYTVTLLSATPFCRLQNQANPYEKITIVLPCMSFMWQPGLKPAASVFQDHGTYRLATPVHKLSMCKTALCIVNN